MLDTLRQICRRLLEEGTVQVVIGYGQLGDCPNFRLGENGTVPLSSRGAVHPVFITRPEDAEQLVWNDACYANLATYLTRPEIRALGKSAIVVKGCDERALVVLEKESQIDRTQIYVIGMPCDGVGQPRRAKCSACDVPVPRYADVIVDGGEGAGDRGQGTGDRGQASHQPLPTSHQPLATSHQPTATRYAELEAFLQLPPEQRLDYWRNELARCVKCYACRQVCPMCYCPRCIVDKNRPVVISTSATLKGNVAWHITRAFHLAGRCVGCDECTRVCPANIDLRLLNLALAKAAEEDFAFRAGMSPEAEPIIGSYAERDREDFIQ